MDKTFFSKNAGHNNQLIKRLYNWTQPPERFR